MHTDRARARRSEFPAAGAVPDSSCVVANRDLLNRFLPTNGSVKNEASISPPTIPAGIIGRAIGS